MFFPKIQDPNARIVHTATKSEGFQKPFYFGGSQVPVSLGMPPPSMSGSGMPTPRSGRAKGYNMTKKV
jgi:hypothetical protein